MHLKWNEKAQQYYTALDWRDFRPHMLVAAIVALVIAYGLVIRWYL